MTAEQFMVWRARLGVNRKVAADWLGIAPNSITAYERGKAIPRVVALACSALALGLAPWGESQPLLDPTPLMTDVAVAA